MARTLQEAQIQAEARRLFYVACTRVKDLLILAGAPSDSQWTGSEISMKLRTLPMPTFGHMWFDALGWQPDDEGRHHFEPKSMPFAVYRHVSEFGDSSIPYSPMVRMNRVDSAANIAFTEVSQSSPTFVPKRTRHLRISPHQLDTAAKCPRCYWQLLERGISPNFVSIHQSNESGQQAAESIGLPPANVIGSIFHRVLEIGLENPGPSSDLSAPLPPQWTEKSSDSLGDESVIQSALDELMPPETDADAMMSLLKQMALAVRNGPLGTLAAGQSWNGESVEGLRTEWPFSLQHNLDIQATEEMWTPHGPRPLANIGRFIFSSSGIADLVLCTRLEDGSGAIRAVDLKTTGAAHLHAGWPHPLLEAEGPSRDDSEKEILNEYRMQLALYTTALIRQEQARKEAGIQHRTVLPPAILSATTGRMILMTEEEMNAAILDLETLLEKLAEMALDEVSISDCDCSLNIKNLHINHSAHTESA